jgi:hypothetical protein
VRDARAEDVKSTGNVIIADIIDEYGAGTTVHQCGSNWRCAQTQRNA